MRGGAALARANVRAIPLRDESVDLIITSPPYFAFRLYRDGDDVCEGQIGNEPTPQEFLESLWDVTRECIRVLRPDGNLFVNLGDKYAGSGGHNNAELARAKNGGGKQSSGLVEGFLRDSPKGYNKSATFATGTPRRKSLMGFPWRYALGCIDDLDLILRSEIVWDKRNYMPESAEDRVARAHEQWFHFSKNEIHFADLDPIFQPAENGLTKMPGSVWEVATDGGYTPPGDLPKHFAAFPQEFPRRLILGWSSPIGICLECNHQRERIVEKESIGEERTGKDSLGTSAKRESHGLNPVNRSDWAPGVVRRTIGWRCACGDSPKAGTRPAVVLDPFGGTGTVAMVARSLGRFGVHLDLSHDYLRLAQWRVFESGHAHKSLSRTNEDAQLKFA